MASRSASAAGPEVGQEPYGRRRPAGRRQVEDPHHRPRPAGRGSARRPDPSGSSRRGSSAPGRGPPRPSACGPLRIPGGQHPGRGPAQSSPTTCTGPARLVDKGSSIVEPVGPPVDPATGPDGPPASRPTGSARRSSSLPRAGGPPPPPASPPSAETRGAAGPAPHRPVRRPPCEDQVEPHRDRSAAIMAHRQSRVPPGRRRSRPVLIDAVARRTTEENLDGSEQRRGRGTDATGLDRRRQAHDPAPGVKGVSSGACGSTGAPQPHRHVRRPERRGYGSAGRNKSWPRSSPAQSGARNRLRRDLGRRRRGSAEP